MHGIIKYIIGKPPGSCVYVTVHNSMCTLWEAPICMPSLNTPDMDVSLCDYVVNVYTHIGILFFYTKLYHV